MSWHAHVQVLPVFVETVEEHHCDSELEALQTIVRDCAAEARDEGALFEDAGSIKVVYLGVADITGNKGDVIALYAAVLKAWLADENDSQPFQKLKKNIRVLSTSGICTSGPCCKSSELVSCGMQIALEKGTGKLRWVPQQICQSRALKLLDDSSWQEMTADDIRAFVTAQKTTNSNQQVYKLKGAVPSPCNAETGSSSQPASRPDSGMLLVCLAGSLLRETLAKRS